MALLAAVLATPPFMSGAARPLIGAESAWDLAAGNRVKEAHGAFSVERGREARFGEAITLLTLQPKTIANLERSAKLLDEVSAVSPADDLALSARYYLARIDQVHRVPTDPAAASRRYTELAGLNSPHPLAQRALVQLALLELFAPNQPDTEIRSRFARLESMGATLSDRAARRDFHLVLGEAAQRLKLGDAPALKHLLAADQAGLQRSITRRDVWIRIAELARVEGRRELAATYYRLFLEAFQRDSRRFMIEQRLAALNSAPEESR